VSRTFAMLTGLAALAACSLNTDLGGYSRELVAGNPCARGGGNACRSGLVCCPRNLVCSTERECAEAPAPSDTEVPAGQSCGYDGDCAEGVCCGISVDDRAGECRSVRACAEASGFVEARPDAGVGDAAASDAGGTAGLAAEICARAYCDLDPRFGLRNEPPSEQHRQACLAAFADGVDAEGRTGLVASESCLAAVSASRDLCSSVLRWRQTQAPLTQDRLRPVYPGPCYSPALAAPVVADAACRRLVACGRAPDAERCVVWVAPLGHDTLSRVADSSTCDFSRERFGHGGRGLYGRCLTSGDCASGLRCEPGLVPGGLCVLDARGCDEGACRLAGGVCWQGQCTLACEPNITTPGRLDPYAPVARLCNGRVNPEGSPGELACLASAQGGVCVGAPELARCPGGATDRVTVGGSPWIGMYRCREVTPGTRGRFEACDPSLDECAVGVCNPTLRRCLVPCVMTLADAPAATCPAGELCVSGNRTPGWGSVGTCQRRCGDGSSCPSGTACEDAWPARACY
jgi:hypothetical protein